jgi:inward rectifier potassium channel
MRLQCEARVAAPAAACFATTVRLFAHACDIFVENATVTTSSNSSPLAARIAADAELRDRDLGFGAVVSGHRARRLLNRDGSFNVVREGLGLLATIAPYHLLLSIRWAGFIAVVTLLYLVLNLAFALLFLACGPDALAGPAAHMLGGRFSQAFFFSIQTFATIGYGQIGPNGLAANVLVTIEALVGLMYQALATGLLFARFSRPTAAIVFSRQAIIAPYAGMTSLQFRIANQRRRNEIIELEAQVLYTSFEKNDRGQVVRRYRLLPLERNKVTFFPLAWTIVHPIDEGSPLAGKSREDLERDEAEILVLLTGVDETYEQTVHARTSYRADEIVWNARFRSVFRGTSSSQLLAIDVTRLHDIERV